MKIMVVDDEKETCEHLAKMLRRKSHETMTCGDGKSAVAMYKANKPEVIFLDFHLPELDGEEVFDEIKKLDPNVKIYFITGSQEDIEKLKEKNKPADGFILKPIMLGDIFKLLEENK